MAEKKSPSFLQGLWKWLREPAAWVSLSGAFVSVLTFFLVYANPGKLQVILPVDVGLHLQSGNLEVILALTLTNTGAPRTRRHVITVLTELRPEDQSSFVPLTMRWESEWTFVGALEFFRKYPDEKKRKQTYDYLYYVSRAAPFAVIGGQSITKVMKFTNRERKLQKDVLKRFQLKVLIKTEKEEYTQTALFECRTDIGEDQFDWCERNLKEDSSRFWVWIRSYF
jgi:hypothetical protein